MSGPRGTEDIVKSLMGCFPTDLDGLLDIAEKGQPAYGTWSMRQAAGWEHYHGHDLRISCIDWEASSLGFGGARVCLVRARARDTIVAMVRKQRDLAALPSPSQG